MDLAAYDKRKFELGELLRRIELLLPHSAGSRDDSLRELFTRLAEDRFNLVVVGRFNRGKSTLMNAILGMDRLPVGIVPLTSVITAVSYGSEEAVEITFENRLTRAKVPLDELAQYVTQEGNPGNRRGIKQAEVQLPAEILRRGFCFIDTPGLGSAVDENTETTRAFLPSADALLLVTGYDSPLSADEFAVLCDASGSGKRVFVALNKQDLVSADSRAQAFAFVEAQLQRIYETDRPQLFSTSAIAGLNAKLAGDGEMLEASGVAELERELIRFLVNDKSAEFLRRMSERIAQLLDAVPAGEEANMLRDRLAAIDCAAHPERSDMSPPRIGGLETKQSEKAAACEICCAIDQATLVWLRRYQYELIAEPEERANLADRGGFCGLHTWWYANVSSPHGVTIAYPELLEIWAGRLAAAANGEHGPGSKIASAIEAHLGTPATCALCAVCAESEVRSIDALVRSLEDDRRRLDALSAICLPHLPTLIRRISDEALVRELLRRQAGLTERIAEDMRRYALKFDGLRRSLLSEAENQAWMRALRLVAGLRNLSFTKRID